MIAELSPHVRLTEAPDGKGGLLIDAQTLALVQLNESAHLIMSLALKEESWVQFAARFASLAECKPAEARRVAREFLAQLHGEGWVRFGDGGDDG